MSDGPRSNHEEGSLSLDGRETALGPGSLSFKRIDDAAFDIVSKVNTRDINFGKVSHFAFSPDGTTLTETKTQTLREVVPEGVDKTAGAVLKTSTFMLVFYRVPTAKD